ncbi:formate dehydrogenase accessory sulfurtransferase FdhD [Chitinilyticum litopenaei]|uniref:formate dehydrogenase accessory sulfurtransferase FdhD n=1 Tax=Chitinilyticum litopenaei TaxID=1121276 RepID=UPI00041EC004|nr:formate dehydrogenase accessory sulfurtransferase FdhD [Chitinilyticum litopenaei]
MKSEPCRGIKPALALRLQHGESAPADELLADEAPLALHYNGVEQLVTLCTPTSLEELAIGFTLSEGIVPAYHQILDIAISREADCYRADIRIPEQYAAQLRAQAPRLTSRTSCGLCGSRLEQVLRPLPVAGSNQCFPTDAIHAGLARLAEKQTLNQACGGLHAAGWLGDFDDGLLVREDIGRHNALDKLIGALAPERERGDGVLLLTSRVSLEMLQKAARAAMPVVVAISAPTALAVDWAQQAGITLAGFARQGRMTVYTHPQRIVTVALG